MIAVIFEVEVLVAIAQWPGDFPGPLHAGLDAQKVTRNEINRLAGIEAHSGSTTVHDRTLIPIRPVRAVLQG